jgi:hypothetical protein
MSFLDSVEQHRKKMKSSSFFKNEEQLRLMDGELALLGESVRDLDEFAKNQSDDKKQSLESIAYHSDARVQSFILLRLDQIEKGQGGEKEQLEESEDEVDRESVPPTVFAESKAGPRTVKSKNPKKSKKK